MKETRNKKFIIYTVVSILIISIGVTLAYWVAQILGENTNMTFTLGEVKVIFTDSESISVENIKPGWSTSKTFSIENQGSDEFYYNIILKDLINTTVSTNSFQYKITSTNGYNMTEYANVPKSTKVSKTVIAENIRIAGNTTQEYIVEIRYYDDPNENQSEDMGKEFSGSLFIEEGTIKPNSLYSKILSDHSTVLTRTNFDEVVGTSTATEGVIYKTTESYETEDGSEVYYFAGNVSDNWVKFGRDKDNAELYWRIIRTNEDGSVRLLYAGTSPSTTSGYISTTNPEYNKSYNDTMYVGYMYGTTGSLDNNRTNENSSTIKTEIDTWYANGLNVKTDGYGRTYDSYVSKTAIYCNDRSTVDYQVSGTMFYGVYNRLQHNRQDGRKATYKCGYNPVDTYRVSGSGSTWNSTSIGMHANADVADKFSVDTSRGGNGDLEYPVGLMTADEVAYAGGSYEINSPYAYYYLNSVNGSVTDTKLWWTMSPFNFDGSYAYVFLVYGSSISGYLYNNYVSNTSYVARPVISLKSCARVSGGNGTASEPYTMFVDETCASSVN